MIELKKLFVPVPVLCGALVLAGCATATPEVVLESHGDSVRNMIAEQTYTPEAVVPPLDGDKSRKALNAYREHVGDAKKVEKEVLQINLN